MRRRGTSLKRDRLTSLLSNIKGPKMSLPDPVIMQMVRESIDREDIIKRAVEKATQTKRVS